MTESNYKVSTRRGRNMVDARPQRIGEPSNVPGARWATGRYVKVSMPGKRWTATDVWTLKLRADDGSVQVLATNRSRESAQQFVDSAKLKTPEEVREQKLEALRRAERLLRETIGALNEAKRELPELREEIETFTVPHLSEFIETRTSGSLRELWRIVKGNEEVET